MRSSTTDQATSTSPEKEALKEQRQKEQEFFRRYTLEKMQQEETARQKFYWQGPLGDLDEAQKKAMQAKERGGLASQSNESFGDGVYDVKVMVEYDKKTNEVTFGKGKEYVVKVQQLNGQISLVSPQDPIELYAASVEVIIQAYGARLGEKELTFKLPNCSVADVAADELLRKTVLEKMLVTLQVANKYPGVMIKFDMPSQEILATFGSKIADKQKNGKALTKEEAMINEIRKLEKELITKRTENKEIQSALSKIEEEKKESEIKAAAGKNIPKIENSSAALGEASKELAQALAKPDKVDAKEVNTKVAEINAKLDDLKTTMSAIEGELDKKPAQAIAAKYQEALVKAQNVINDVDKQRADHIGKDLTTTQLSDADQKTVKVKMDETGKSLDEVKAKAKELAVAVDVAAANPDEKPGKYQTMLEAKTEAVTKAMAELKQLDAKAPEKEVAEKIDALRDAVTGLDRVMDKVNVDMHSKDLGEQSIKAYDGMLDKAFEANGPNEVIDSARQALVHESTRLDVKGKSPELEAKMQVVNDGLGKVIDKIDKMKEASQTLVEDAEKQATNTTTPSASP